MEALTSRNIHRGSIYDAASFFYSRVGYNPKFMSHLKLHHLCYYAQAWHLVYFDIPLIHDYFEAWNEGAICQRLWRSIYKRGFKFIEEYGNTHTSPYTEEQVKLLLKVEKAYGRYDGNFLRNLVCKEDPWIIAEKGYYEENEWLYIISLESMKEYYSKHPMPNV